MQLKNYNELEKAVKQAQFVLIGLGEEWVLSEQEIAEQLKIDAPVLAHLYIRALSNDNYASLLPMFNAYYYHNFIPQYLKIAYDNLLQLVQDKEYFIVSLTVDSYLKKIENCVNPCGSYEMLQCNAGCNETLVSGKEILQELEQVLNDSLEVDYDSQEELDRILLRCVAILEKRKCDKCESELHYNLLDAGKYREEGYLSQWQCYMKWLQKTLNKELCVIEAGVGMKLPSVIRWPFEKTVFYNQKAKMFRIHEKFYQVNEEIADRAYGCQCNSVIVFRDKNVEAF